MNRLYRFHPRPLVVLAAIVLVLCASIAFAQTTRGAVSIGTTRSATVPQVALPGTGTSRLPAGAPAPAGLGATATTTGSLPSPLPFPAGIPSTVIAAPGTSAAGSGSVAATGNGVVIVPGNAGATLGSAPLVVGTDVRTRTAILTGEGTIAVDGGGSNTAVMGASGVPAATYGSPVAAAPRTALELLQTFQQADMNGDGALSRAEAQRIALPATFEELDLDKDGLLSRGEYNSAFGR